MRSDEDWNSSACWRKKEEVEEEKVESSAGRGIGTQIYLRVRIAGHKTNISFIPSVAKIPFLEPKRGRKRRYRCSEMRGGDRYPVVFREMPQRVFFSQAFPTEFVSFFSSIVFTPSLLLISWINWTTPPSKIMRRKRRLFCCSKSNSLQGLMRSFAYGDETINALSLSFQ